MSVQCTICYAWCPKQWDGSKGHWGDTAAKCEIKGRFTTAKESCESGAIVRPKHEVKHFKQTVLVQADEKKHSVVQATAAPKLTGELYAHQQEAFDRFKDQTEIALFMEMGTGKSATVLKIVAHKFKQGEINALLIVAPNDVHVQWYKEQLPLWLSCNYDVQCLFGRGGAKVAYPFTDEPDTLQVVCVNIDTFSTPSKWQDIVEWANLRDTFIVLDEATVIKNVSAKRTERILYAFNNVVRKGKTIKSSTPRTKGRAILTGTPVTNGPMDLWAMMEFLRPNYFGRNWYSFQAHYAMFTRISVNDREINVPLNEETWMAIKRCMTYGEAYNVFGCSEDTYSTVHSQDHYVGPYKHADELREAIKPVSYFKQLKDCVDMPEQVYQVRAMDMTPEIRQCYDDMVSDLIATYENTTMTAKNKLTAMIRLQQICSGFLVEKKEQEPVAEEEEQEDVVSRLFGLCDEEDVLPNELQWIGNSNPKLDMLYRDIDELAKPLIIITRFTAEADRIYNDLSGKYRVCLQTGWKRVGTIEEFKEGQYDIMVANSAVVARGFNLQNSNTILFYSNTFSLELRLQAEGRIFRLGQRNACHYIDYAYNDSIDEKVTAALSMKRNLLDYIRGAEVRDLV